MANRKKCQYPAFRDVCGEPSVDEIADIPLCVRHYDLFMDARERLKIEYGEKEADETIECVVRGAAGDEEWYDWPEDDENEEEE